MARAAEHISVGDVLRAVNGSITTVRGMPVRQSIHEGDTDGVGRVWLSVSRAIEEVVDAASVADLLEPPH